MAASPLRTLRHLFVAGSARDIPFTAPPSGGGGGASFPVRDRAAHARKLLDELEKIRRDAAEDQQRRQTTGAPGEHGIAIEFAAGSGHPLATQRLDRRSQGITLLNIRTQPVPQGEGVFRPEEFATVRIPFGKIGVFEDLIRDYRDKFTRIPGSITPQHEPLVASIGAIRKALFEAFWTSPVPLPESGLNVPL